MMTVDDDKKTQEHCERGLSYVITPLK